MRAEAEEVHAEVGTAMKRAASRLVGPHPAQIGEGLEQGGCEQGQGRAAWVAEVARAA